MPTLFTDDFEGEGSNPAFGAPITTSNTAFTYVRNSPVFSATAVTGSRAMSCVTETASDKYVRAPLEARSNSYLRFYIRRASSTVTDLCRLLDSAQASVRAVLRMTATGAIQQRSNSASVGSTSTTVIPTNTWVRVEWAVLATTQQVRLFIGANLHGTTPDYESVVATWTPTGTYAFADFGITSSTISNVIVDDILVDGTNWPGPSVSNTPPVVDAGPDQTVRWPTTVTLSASAQGQGGATIVGYNWAQVSGISTAITNPTNMISSVSPTPSLVPTIREFQVTVTDSNGLTATNITQVVTPPHEEWYFNGGGELRPQTTTWL